MNTTTGKTLALKLLIATLLFLAAGLGRPAAAYAQSAPSGTGKTVGTALLGKQESVNEFPWQVGLQAHDADAESTTKIPGIYKVADVTLKRG